MEDLARLCRLLESAASPADQAGCVRAALIAAEPPDRAWTLFWLAGRRRKRVLTFAQLQELAKQAAPFPQWLFDESQQTVGDAAETAALLMARPYAPDSSPSLAAWMNENWPRLAETAPENLPEALTRLWGEMSVDAAYLWNRMICGRPVCEGLESVLLAALEAAFGLAPTDAVEWLGADWQPADVEARLVPASAPVQGESYRFAPVLRVEHEADSAFDPKVWRYEWAFEGLRVQLHRSPSGERRRLARKQPLPAGLFPVLDDLLDWLPDGSLIEAMLCGEGASGAISNAKLESSLKRPPEDARWRVQVYDVLQWEGRQWERQPYERRKAFLVESFDRSSRPEGTYYVPSHAWSRADELRAVLLEGRQHRPLGLVLKHVDSPYLDPERPWQRLAPPPATARAALLYVGQLSLEDQTAELTLGLRMDEGWAPFARVEREFDAEEWKELTELLKESTLERFGPVRSVEIKWVYELAFERLSASNRTKSGVQAGGARILNRLPEVPPETCDDLGELRRLWGL